MPRENQKEIALETQRESEDVNCQVTHLRNLIEDCASRKRNHYKLR